MEWNPDVIRMRIDAVRGKLEGVANAQPGSPGFNPLAVHALAALLASYDRELDRELEGKR